MEPDGPLLHRLLRQLRRRRGAGRARLLLLDPSVEAVLVGAVDLAAGGETLAREPSPGTLREGLRTLGEGAGAVVVTRPDDFAGARCTPPGLRRHARRPRTSSPRRAPTRRRRPRTHSPPPESARPTSSWGEPASASGGARRTGPGLDRGGRHLRTPPSARRAVGDTGCAAGSPRSSGPCSACTTATCPAPAGAAAGRTDGFAISLATGLPALAARPPRAQVRRPQLRRRLRSHAHLVLTADTPADRPRRPTGSGGGPVVPALSADFDGLLPRHGELLGQRRGPVGRSDARRPRGCPARQGRGRRGRPGRPRGRSTRRTGPARRVVPAASGPPPPAATSPRRPSAPTPRSRWSTPARSTPIRASAGCSGPSRTAPPLRGPGRTTGRLLRREVLYPRTQEPPGRRELMRWSPASATTSPSCSPPAPVTRSSPRISSATCSASPRTAASATASARGACCSPPEAGSRRPPRRTDQRHADLQGPAVRPAPHRARAVEPLRGHPGRQVWASHVLLTRRDVHEALVRYDRVHLTHINTPGELVSPVTRPSAAR